MSNEQILIVEDEGLVAEDIKAHLEENGWQVPAIVPTGEQALELLESKHIDLVLMDIVLTGERDGIDTAAIIKEIHQTPVIYLTAYTDREKVERARKTDPYGYLVKPFDERELKTTVAMTLSKSINDRAIREGRRWANAVLNSIEDGVITTDSSGRIRDINPKALMMAGKSSDQCIEQLLIDVLSFDETETQLQLKHAMEKILQFGADEQYHIKGELQHGADNIFIDAKLSGITYEDGLTDGLVIAFHDITLEHRARLQLQEYNVELEHKINERTEDIRHALDRAETANITKNRFLANISHELRTPMNPISACSQMLMNDKSIGGKQRDWSTKIYHACHALLEKIDNLIELSRLETNNFSSEHVTFDPVQSIESTIDKFQQLASDKNITLDKILPENKPVEILGHATHLTRILNLLTQNALQFTTQGKVVIGTEVLNEDAESVSLRFTVDDNGPGIDEKIISNLFDHFNQADDSSTRVHEGLGIGLTLCNQLVKYMGGKIGIENKPDNDGAVVWFELTFKKGK